jgi:hypothetical protein
VHCLGAQGGGRRRSCTQKHESSPSPHLTGYRGAAARRRRCHPEDSPAGSRKAIPKLCGAPSPAFGTFHDLRMDLSLLFRHHVPALQCLVIPAPKLLGQSLQLKVIRRRATRVGLRKNKRAERSRFLRLRHSDRLCSDLLVHCIAAPVLLVALPSAIRLLVGIVAEVPRGVADQL